MNLSRLLLCLVLFGWVSSARAEDAAFLVCTFSGDVVASDQTRFIEAIEEGLSTASVIPLSSVQTRLGAMAPEALDCKEPTCLERAGQALEVKEGYVFQIDEKAGSFTITGARYELAQARALQTVKKTCEGCTANAALGTAGDVAQGLLGGGTVARAEPPSDAPRKGVLQPTLGVFVNPPDAQIVIDGKPRGKGRFEGNIPTGTHTVTLERAGYRTVEEEVTVLDGSGPTYLVVHMREVEDLGPVSARSGGWLEGVDTDILGWSVVGGGGLLLVTGAILLAFDGEPLCTGPVAACPDVFETTGAGTTLAVLGGAAISAGVIFLLWDEFAGTEMSDDTTVGIGIDPAGGGAVWMRTRW